MDLFEGRSEELRAVDAPRISASTPFPQVFANERGLVFYYYCEGDVVHFDGTQTHLFQATAETEPVAVVTVDLCDALQFGPPNDEAIAGHRLAPLGLRGLRSSEFPMGFEA